MGRVSCWVSFRFMARVINWLFYLATVRQLKISKLYFEERKSDVQCNPRWSLVDTGCVQSTMYMTCYCGRVGLSQKRHSSTVQVLLCTILCHSSGMYVHITTFDIPIRLLSTMCVLVFIIEEIVERIKQWLVKEDCNREVGGWDCFFLLKTNSKLIIL